MSAASLTGQVAAFKKGLQSVGYTEGKNVEIEFRWAEGHYDRLPALATDLVRRQVAVIVTIGGGPPAFAAKAASTTIPIVFMVGRDPVEMGLVKSLNRPGGNATGINLLIVEMKSKRIELIRQLAPTSNVFAILVNPKSPDADVQLRAVQSAADALNEQIKIFNASNEIELERAFANFREDNIGGLILVADPFFMNRRDQIISSAAQGRFPALYFLREFVESGGLASYGSNLQTKWPPPRSQVLADRPPLAGETLWPPLVRIAVPPLVSGAGAPLGVFLSADHCHHCRFN